MVRTVEVRRADVMTHSVAASWTRLIVLSVLFFLIFLALIGCGGGAKDRCHDQICFVEKYVEIHKTEMLTLYHLSDHREMGGPMYWPPL